MMGDVLLRAIEALLAIGASAVVYSWWQVAGLTSIFVG
jgi:hypothetical protein